MRRTAPRGLAPALSTVVEQVRPATRLARIQEAWPIAVGRALAAEAQPVAERGGVVTVACHSAVWAQELQLLGDELVEGVNRCLATPDERSPVGSLRFVTGVRADGAPRP